MQTTRNSPHKKSKFLDTKVFIATLSIAVTVGLWNLFSNEAILATKANSQPDQSPSPSTENQGYDLPPIPTLIPLVNVTSNEINKNATTNNVQPAELRSVSAPDQVIVQKVKPVFDQASTVSNGGSRSSSNSSASSGVTTTRSSR